MKKRNGIIDVNGARVEKVTFLKTGVAAGLPLNGQIRPESPLACLQPYAINGVVPIKIVGHFPGPRGNIVVFHPQELRSEKPKDITALRKGVLFSITCSTGDPAYEKLSTVLSR